MPLSQFIIPCVIAVFTISIQYGLTSSHPTNAPGYLGCFVMMRDNNIAIRKDSGNQSIEWCFRYCLETVTKPYKYAKVENAKECFCGNDEDHDQYEEKEDSECQDKCTGNSNQICGDSERISIYIISRGVCSNDIGPPTNGSHRITNPHSLSYNLNNFKFFGTRVDFYCHDGYTLRGASSIQCIDTEYNNVMWNDTVPTCEENVSVTAVEDTTISRMTTDTSQETTSENVSVTLTAVEDTTKTRLTTDDLETTGVPQQSKCLITGIAVGMAVGIIVFATSVIFVWKKRQKQRVDISLPTDGPSLLKAVFKKPVQPQQGTVPEYKPNHPTTSDEYTTHNEHEVIILPNNDTPVTYCQLIG